MEISIKSSSSLNPANSSKAFEESVTVLNQALELNPGNTVARQALYETMQQLLRRDAFLAYQGETDVIYRIRTLAEFQFFHPKDRAMAELFPPQNSPPAQSAIHWLGWSVVGLIPAGLGTLVLAPVAIIAACKLLGQPAELIDRRRAWIVMGVAIVLWLVALVFIFILTLHLV